MGSEQRGWERGDPERVPQTWRTRGGRQGQASSLRENRWEDHGLTGALEGLWRELDDKSSPSRSVCAQLITLYPPRSLFFFFFPFIFISWKLILYSIVVVFAIQ